MITLSLAMIVKNEGATIERALSCARLFADEMIVVDTGSTDDTVAKAEAMGAKVRHFSRIDDFATAQRQGRSTRRRHSSAHGRQHDPHPRSWDAGSGSLWLRPTGFALPSAFPLENIDAARRLAAEALERKPPQTKWLAELARWDEAAPAFEPLPPQWQGWTEGNLGKGVPRWTIIRILEENGFGPRQIVEGLRTSDRKARPGKT